jgi:mRNA interferase YafQ
VLKASYARQFTRDVSKAKKRAKDMIKLHHLMELLINESVLSVRYRNHKLKGDFKDCWECHIEPDWLLVYRKSEDEIIFIRTGSHADLFE